jgi:hypothetical protein
LLGCVGRGRAPRDNDVDLQPDQFSRQRGEPIRFPIPVSPLYGQVLPLDVTAAGPGIKMPTRGTLPVRPIGCCARAASGHTTLKDKLIKIGATWWW